jgi:hypothetical protein
LAFLILLWVLIGIFIWRGVKYTKTKKKERKPQWMHVIFRPKDYMALLGRFYNEAFPQTKPGGSYKKLISYFKDIVDSLSPDLISRYFFLFQFVKGNPHIALSLEANDKNHISQIQKRIEQIKIPEFIEPIDSSNATIKSYYNLDSHDEGNGEAAVDFFHAAAKFIFYRISPKYEPGYNKIDETKVIHCFANPLFGANPYSEILLYMKCAHARGFPIEFIKECLSHFGDFPQDRISEWSAII